MAAVGLILFLGLLWALPIWLSGSIGRRKGKQEAWLWGLFLGWIGVAIVSFSATRQPLILPAPPRQLA